MGNGLERLIDELASHRSLPLDAYEELIVHRTPELAAYAAQKALQARASVYGTDVFVRGLIEFSSYCKNDCLYCGLRRSNARSDRYRLTPEQIVECADEGYRCGFRTFVLQSGEDPLGTDDMLGSLIFSIKQDHPDCAITLSLGERSRESYERLFEAGADRYLLRHETADPIHYAKLHPKSMSYDNRMRCIEDLRDIGYTVGIGFMVGTPYQGPRELACDLKFVEEFQPGMCGIGPFVSHHATPFAQMPNGSVELTCYLLSLMRLIQPNLLIPATTSLSTLDPDGCEKGILSGANVVMPNLSPVSVRARYDLYDNKANMGVEAAECRASLDARLKAIGHRVVVDRGDPRPMPSLEVLDGAVPHEAPSTEKEETI